MTRLMPYDEDELLPLSALQHLAFCERQWGLIHLEGIWDENRLTAEGRHLHSRVDSPEAEVRTGVRTSRGLRLRSLCLGLSGKADVVEFHRIDEAGTNAEALCQYEKPPGMKIDCVPGFWRPVPVEYKRGRPKKDRSDEVQLCAQALCLEEMMEVDIPYGALFYWSTRRRYEVTFDMDLRRKTEALSARLHELVRSGRTPAGRYSGKCRKCSLLNLCMPKAVGCGRRVSRYIMSAIRGAAKDAG